MKIETELICDQRITQICSLCDGEQDSLNACPLKEKLLYVVPAINKDSHCIAKKTGSCLPCHRLIDNIRPNCPEGLSPLPVARAKRSIW